MPFLTICALAAGAIQNHQHKTVEVKPLGPASRVFVAPVDAKSGSSATDVVRYLNRHAIPAGLIATLRPIKASVSKVNQVISMNAVLVIAASPRLTLSVYMLKPTAQADLSHAAPAWTTVLMGTGPGAVNSGLDTLVTQWRHDHVERTRKR